MGGLFNLVIIVGFILAVRYALKSFRKMSDALNKEDDPDDLEIGPDGGSRALLELENKWRQAAQQISCKFDPGNDPRGKDAAITGRFSGHAVTIKRFGRSYVRYFVAFRRAPAFQVCVVRDLETIAERILDGHPVFPSKTFFSSREPFFYCSAENEDAFRRFLDVPSNRSAVLNLVHLFPAGMFNTEGVSVRLRAKAPDVSVISGMAAIADALENPSQKPMPDLLTATKKEPVPLPQASVGDHAPSVPEAEERPSKRFPPIQVESGPARKTSKLQPRMQDPDASRRTTVIRIAPEEKPGREPDAAQESIVRISDRTHPAAKQAPPLETPAKPVEKQAPPLETPVKRVETPRKPAETKAAPVPEPSASSAPSSADSSLTVESVCAALFTKSFPGAEERAAFDAMKGRRVRWSGEPAMVLPFSMDFVFGMRKGVKATILLRRTTQGPAGFQVQIKAVAAFPPELRPALEALKGRTIAFEGELIKFEPFAREIYLQDASLVSDFAHV